MTHCQFYRFQFIRLQIRYEFTFTVHTLIWYFGSTGLQIYAMLEVCISLQKYVVKQNTKTAFFF